MELTVASCFELGRALRDEDADSFLRHYDSLLGSLQFNFAGIQLTTAKEFARQISELSDDDFSLLESAYSSEHTHLKSYISSEESVVVQLMDTLEILSYESPKQPLNDEISTVTEERGDFDEALIKDSSAAHCIDQPHSMETSATTEGNVCSDPEITDDKTMGDTVHNGASNGYVKISRTLTSQQQSTQYYSSPAVDYHSTSGYQRVYRQRKYRNRETRTGHCREQSHREYTQRYPRHRGQEYRDINRNHGYREFKGQRPWGNWRRGSGRRGRSRTMYVCKAHEGGGACDSDGVWRGSYNYYEVVSFLTRGWRSAQRELAISVPD